VLLRAGVVLEGLSAARARRNGPQDRDLARGPARLAQALGLDRRHSGLDLLDPNSKIRLEWDGWHPAPAAILHGPRTGVRHAADEPWRCWVNDVAEVSPYRRHPTSVPARPNRA
jgi:DNA-3-methyladenine glycosylase